MDEFERNVEICNNLQEQKGQALADIAVYEKKIAEYSKGIRDAYMDKVKGVISEGDYVEISKAFTAERERLESVLAQAQKHLSEVEGQMEAGDTRRELIDQYTNLDHLTRDIVEILIDHISVGSVFLGHGLHRSKSIGISKRLYLCSRSICCHVFREVTDRIAFYPDGGCGKGEAGGGSGVNAGSMIHEIGGEARVVLNLFIGEVSGELVYDGGDHLHVAQLFGTDISQQPLHLRIRHRIPLGEVPQGCPQLPIRTTAVQKGTIQRRGEAKR